MAGSDSTVNTSRDLLNAFNHKEVGYPVTETQRRAKSPLSTRPLLFILSYFSLFAPDAKYKAKGEADRKGKTGRFWTLFFFRTQLGHRWSEVWVVSLPRFLHSAFRSPKQLLPARWRRR